MSKIRALASVKKQEKIDVLRKGIEEISICRCYFAYDQNYFYYYPNAVNDKFMLGQEEDDFLLDGYSIRRITHLEKVEIKDDKCSEINRLFGIAGQVVHPGIDISSWRSIFEFLSQADAYIQIEDAFNEQFAIGIVEKVLKDRIYFKSFDVNGVWDEDGLEIRYSQITSVSWGTRYTCFVFDVQKWAVMKKIRLFFGITSVMGAAGCVMTKNNQ